MTDASHDASHDDDEEDDEDLELRCRRCTGTERPAEPPTDRRELAAALPPEVVASLPDGLAGELVRCVRCLAHDGATALHAMQAAEILCASGASRTSVATV